MAYMNQAKKKLLAPKIKSVLKEYDIKGSISVHNYSTLIVNIKSGKLDMIKNYVEVSNPLWEVGGNIPVNPYCISESFSGDSQEFLIKLNEAMNKCDDLSNHDNSDLMFGYYDVGWYIEINIGQWDKPYKLTKG